MSPADIRARRADVTRQAILDAARRLFAARGYARTGIREIAAEAGVAVQTIYSAFGSKAGLLEAMFELIEREAQVAELSARASEADDPRQMIAFVSQMHRRLYERCGDLIDMFVVGAAADEDVRRMAEAGPELRRGAVSAMVGLLKKRGLLAAGLDPATAEAAVTVLLSAEGHREAVGHRGMSYDEYEVWLAEAVQRILLS